MTAQFFFGAMGKNGVFLSIKDYKNLQSNWKTLKLMIKRKKNEKIIPLRGAITI